MASLISNSLSAAQERFRSDKRQIAGMMLLFSAGALVFPQANLASLIGPEGWPDDDIPRTSLIASVFVISMGVLGISTGFLQLVHDYSNRYLTGFLLAFVQLAWVPYITDMTNVGKLARSGAAFIPAEYDPSAADVRFVGAMGILGILSYGCAFLGSLSFTAFALYSFQAGKPGDRSGAYYRGRLTLYSVVIFIAGLSQLLLGIYILTNIGAGPLPKGPVGVAMYFVFFPEISIFVGLVQILNACLAMCRRFGIADGPDNHLFQYTSIFQWLCMLSLQIMTQVAYAPGGNAAARAPSAAAMFLGIVWLPAFLDYKMRNTPAVLPADYYGLDESKDANSKKDSASSVEEEGATNV